MKNRFTYITVARNTTHSPIAQNFIYTCPNHPEAVIVVNDNLKGFCPTQNGCTCILTVRYKDTSKESVVIMIERTE